MPHPAVVQAIGRVRSSPRRGRGSSDIELGAAAQASAVSGRIWLLVAALTLAHAAAATVVALYASFPSAYDELAHISLVRSMAEAPQLFLPYGRLMLLDPTLQVWTSEPNYLAHPSLYYLALSPLAGWGYLPLRFANVALSSLALLLAAAGGARLIGSGRGLVPFLILLFCFPKSPVLGGIVSNDNLVLLASAVFLWGCSSGRHRTAWIAAAIVLAGWAKLTALVALGATVTFVQMEAVLAGRTKVFARENVWFAAAALTGFCPCLVNYATTGHFLFGPVNEGWIIPAGQRVSLSVPDFVWLFFQRLGAKYPLQDMLLQFGPLLAGLVAIASLPLRGGGTASVVAKSSMLALLVFVTIHVGYGWHTFQITGRETADAQIRYYNVLWPGFALALALNSGKLDPRGWPLVTCLVIGVAAIPTMLGFVLMPGA